MVISQQAATGLLHGRSFQMELGVLTSEDLNLNQQDRELVVVSAASFSPLIAPGSIATAFGTRLASADAAAAVLPLPINLAGSTVLVNGRLSQMFYISDDAPLGYGQVNFFVPEDTEEGLAQIVVTAADGTRSVGSIQVGRVAPAPLYHHPPMARVSLQHSPIRWCALSVCAIRGRSGRQAELSRSVRHRFPPPHRPQRRASHH